MNLWAASIALGIGVVVWLLLVRRLHARSWETSGMVLSAPGDAGALNLPPAKIGLWVFLGVATSLFALFMTAYYLRMGHGHAAGMVSDWHPIDKPVILWFNTTVLVLSSLAMQLAHRAAGLSQPDRASAHLIAGGAFAAMFLTGQLAAWQQLRAAGCFITSGPAGAFYYVLTAVHGLHLLGGLWVWFRTTARLWTRRAELIDVRLSIDLCTTYWHYLLLVWLALFALLLAT